MRDWMHLKYNKLFLLILFLLVFVLSENSMAHNFIGNIGCFECHEKLPIKEEAKILKPDIEKICYGCHDFKRKFTHPAIGVIPKKLIPLDLPLSQDGKVTCVTCHDIHMSAVNKLTGKKTYYLRRAVTGKKFCYSCHPKPPV
jgi:predicted CXXCH cytochrome family protein